MAVAQFSGLASGIDSASLIDAIIEARETVNVKRKSDIEYYKSSNDSLDELNSKILALNDLVDKFRTVNGGGLKKKAASSDSSVLTASAGSNSVNSSFDLTVNNLAKSACASFSQSYTSTDSYVSTSGSGDVTVSIGTGSNKKDITVSVTANETTVGDLVDAINSSSNAAGRLSASMINVSTDSSPSYKIMLTGLKQGTDEGTMAISVGAGITELQTNTLTADTNAKNASLSVAGISGTIQRSSNSISDVVPGVTMQLLDDGSSTVSVDNDSQSTYDLMTQIVDAYNEIVEYVNENDTVTSEQETDDDGETSTSITYGTLAKTRVDNDFLEQFRTQLTNATADHGTSIKKLSQMGISTNRDGTISIDEEDFKAAIADDSLGAEEVLTEFADASAGTTGFMYQFTKFDGYIDLAEESNDNKVDNLNDSVEQLERTLATYRSGLEKQYAALESTIAKMQSEQSSLSSALSSLG